MRSRIPAVYGLDLVVVPSEEWRNGMEGRS
jgi:hypothetical protein